jgi:hypothetical protein
MDLSPAHEAARQAAQRLPALQASFDLLDGASNPTIDFYTAPRPDPGDTPTGTLLVTVNMADPPGSVDDEAFEITVTVPIEGLIAETGVTTWARITDGDGAWWADASVSEIDGVGEIQLASTSLVEGATARITNAVFRG